jgi:hypothetical protein
MWLAMDTSGPPGATRDPNAGFGRGAAFSFRCARCRRCCSGTRVRINPYDVARLARRLGLSFAEFRDRFTEDGQGTALARTAAEACVFLGTDGCTVHADRALICRLHPLSLNDDADGNEAFGLSPMHPPDSEGRFGVEGTVADFLVAQGAEPFIAAGLAYRHALRRMSGRRIDPPDALIDVDPLDLEQMVAAYCAWKGIAVPATLEDRVPLHAQALLALMGDSEEPGPS